MKYLYIPAKKKVILETSKILELSKKLPKNIALAYSVQYENIAKKIKELFSESHKITAFLQVLGCSDLSTLKNTQAVVLVSDGSFHASSLVLRTRLPVYVLYNNNIRRISESEIEELRKKKKAVYLKYLNADRIGILISTKPGQENLKKALKFKKNSRKRSYLFLGNNINKNEFENFPVDSWVNTACLRLDLDIPIINLEDLNSCN